MGTYHQGYRCAFYLTVFVLGGVLLGGCNLQPYVNDTRLERGLVIVFPGIEGRSQLNESICKALHDGGVNWAIELKDWTSPLPLGMLLNLGAEHRNRQEAAEIADRVRRYQSAYPNRPVVLVGQSGGGAIAVWVAEELDYAHRIDGIIMLAASLSPKYMLDEALSKTRRGIVSFHSSRDWLLLGLGTTISGTMDGEHTSSAGRMGFEVPKAGGSPRIYKKLFQIAWSEKMARTGNVGSHLSSGSEKFVVDYVAPFVMTGKWDESLIARILNAELLEPVPSVSNIEWDPPVLPEKPSRKVP